MQPGRASRTAVQVCMGRAIAERANPVPGFADPTAYTLLPDDARAQVDRYRDGAPRNLRDRIEHLHLYGLAQMMAVRTAAIDDAVRGAATPQLVILGAGLDGRAWRMPELADVTVFEVDHPDSQRDKRARVGMLASVAKDVRFVPVDFTRDSLDAALAGAGHDPARPTTWIWEGVVMYLTPSEVEASLAIIAKRSAERSRLVVAYHASTWTRRLVGAVTARMGEPLRSHYSHDEMTALLARYDFTVTTDADITTLAESLVRGKRNATRWIRHLRIAVADR